MSEREGIFRDFLVEETENRRIIMGLWGEIKPVSRIKGGLGSSRNVLSIIYFFIRTTFNRRSTNSVFYLNEFNIDYTYIHAYILFLL